MWQQFFTRQREAVLYDESLQPKNPWANSRPRSEQVEVLLARFCVWADEEEKACVKTALVGLRHAFEERTLSTAPFDGPALKNVRAGIVNKRSQRQRALDKEKRIKDPATWDVVCAMREACEIEGENPSVWHQQKWYRFMWYLGGALMFQFLLRFSEVGHSPPEEREGEVLGACRTVVDANPLRPDDVILVFVTGEQRFAFEMKDYADVEPKDICLIKFFLRSAKNIRDGKTEYAFLRSGVSPEVDSLIGDVLTFCIYSVWWTGDIFFSMRFPSGTGRLKQLIAKDLVSLLRFAARSKGLDERRYSTKSLKSGGYTTMDHAGVSRVEQQQQGRHASYRSANAYRHTTVPAANHGSGPLGLIGAPLLSAAEVAQAAAGRALLGSLARPATRRRL